MRDTNEIETAAFWYDTPQIEMGEQRPQDIGTEVFFLPAAAHTEKDGTFTNTQRLLQWHFKAVEPPQDARSELWFAYHLMRRIREKLAASTEQRDRPILDLVWDYLLQGPHDEPDAEVVLQEINGRKADGTFVPRYQELADDGSTTCGSWPHAGIYADGVNQTSRKRPHSEQSWIASEWGWAWPANRHIIYNRASADPEGRPWSERKRYVWWSEDEGAWQSLGDSVDIPPDKAPGFVPADEDATGMAAIRGNAPFIVHPDGLGWLYVPTGLVDGPLPTHYEAHESPFQNPLYAQGKSPTRQTSNRPENPYNPPGGDPGADVFPYVMTTYRLTEHHTVLVTDRIAPLAVMGRTAHQVGLPYHFGRRGLVTGDSANDLLPLVLDLNTHIAEYKTATCDIQPGRRPRGRALLAYVEDYRRRAGVTA